MSERDCDFRIAESLVTNSYKIFFFRFAIGRCTHMLVSQLCDLVANLHIWIVVRPNCFNDAPFQLELTVLTKPLRYSPALLRLLKPWIQRVNASLYLHHSLASWTLWESVESVLTIFQRLGELFRMNRRWQRVLNVGE
jgi:hypothetical protein